MLISIVNMTNNVPEYKKKIAKIQFLLMFSGQNVPNHPINRSSMSYTVTMSTTDRAH